MAPCAAPRPPRSTRLTHVPHRRHLLVAAHVLSLAAAVAPCAALADDLATPPPSASSPAPSSVAPAPSDGTLSSDAPPSASATPEGIDPIAPASSAAPSDAPASTRNDLTLVEPVPPPAARRDPAYYRGRREGLTAGQALLWIPRVALFPLYALTEYGFRYPVRALVRGLEETHAVAYLGRALHPTPNFWWSPSLVVDLGVLTSGGLHIRWERAGLPTNSIRGSFATGGADFWLADLQDRLRVDGFTFGVRGYFLTRPDRPFYGLGPRSDGPRTNYRLTRREAHAFAAWDPTTHFSLALDTFYRAEDTGDGRDPPISTRFQGQDVVPGLGSLQLFIADTHVTIDSRHDRLGPSGVRLDVGGRYAVDPFNREIQFVQGEAELQGAIEVIHPDRALVATVYVADSQPLGSQSIPFTHQIFLGRDRHEGFLYGRFIGESAVLGTLAWRWPIWDQMDMFIQGSVGNVFGRHFQGFDPRLFTGSLGVGLRTRLDNASAMQLILAAGTNRFDEPFGIEGVRFLVSVEPGL